LEMDNVKLEEARVKVHQAFQAWITSFRQPVNQPVREGCA